MYDREMLDKLSQEKEKWEETGLQQTMARFPERREAFITTSSEPVDRVYTPLEVAEMDYFEDKPARRISLHTRHPSDHASRTAVDHAHVCRVWNGGGDQPAL